MKHLLVLSNHWTGECKTGGHFYDENMVQCLSLNPAVKVERFGVLRKQNHFYKLITPLLNIGFLKKCKKSDIVIINSSICWYFLPLAIAIRLFSKTKLLILHHHFLYLEFSGIKKFFYKILEISFLRSSNSIITVSPYIRELCQQKFPLKDIRFWPIPFSDSLIESDIEKNNGGLVYIGTIEPRKGLHYLLHALKILQEKHITYNLQIIGKIVNQTYHDELSHYIKEHNLNVNFLGFIDYEKKDKILKESQLFVFPSLLEGYGMVLREAMSYGLPIVCFDNSAMPYLVKDNVNGFAVENRNIEKMSEAIEKILIDKDLRTKLSDGSYETTKSTITFDKYKILLAKEIENITKS